MPGLILHWHQPRRGKDALFPDRITLQTNPMPYRTYEFKAPGNMCQTSPLGAGDEQRRPRRWEVAAHTACSRTTCSRPASGQRWNARLIWKAAQSGCDSCLSISALRTLESTENIFATHVNDPSPSADAPEHPKMPSWCSSRSR